VTVFVGVLLSVIAVVSFAVMIGGAVWAARKDGEDQAEHRRRHGS
jgi:hypothetical protein